MIKKKGSDILRVCDTWPIQDLLWVQRGSRISAQIKDVGTKWTHQGFMMVKFTLDQKTNQNATYLTAPKRGGEAAAKHKST